jgi:hypothetical protein
MDMRERVAKALGEKHFELRGHGLAFANQYADAVLAAMRTPTEEMLEGFGIHKAHMKQNWQAMIDAASPSLPKDV